MSLYRAHTFHEYDMLLRASKDNDSHALKDVGKFNKFAGLLRSAY